MVELIHTFLEAHSRKLEDSSEIGIAGRHDEQLATSKDDLSDLRNASSMGDIRLDMQSTSLVQRKNRPWIEEISSSGDTGSADLSGNRGIGMPQSGAIETELGNSETPEMLKCVLGILAAMLSVGTLQRPHREEKALRSLLPFLQTIAFREVDTEISQIAADVALLLLTRSATAGEARKNNSTDKDESSECNPCLQTSRLGAIQTESQFARTLLSAVEEHSTSVDPSIRAMGIHLICLALREPEEVRSYFTAALRSSELTLVVSSGPIFPLLYNHAAVNRK
jgi:hypothetical protein